MSDSLVFPYGVVLQEAGAISVFPAAEVRIVSRNGELLSFFFVIDSGATISVLPKSDAFILGVDADIGQPIKIAGIGDNLLRGWRHEIPVRLGRRSLRLPVVFLDNISTPRILGRSGIFDCFTVIFEEYLRRSSLLVKNSKQSAAVKNIIDSIS